MSAQNWGKTSRLVAASASEGSHGKPALRRFRGGPKANEASLPPLRKESVSAGSQSSYSARVAIAEAYDSAVSAESTEPGKTGPTLYSGVETRKPELLAPALQNSQLFPEGFPNALQPATAGVGPPGVD